MKEFASGAKSSELKPRYDLVPLEAIRYIAQRLAYGATTHGENNYKKGVVDTTFIKDRQNHAIEHLFHYVNLETTEDGDGPLEHLSAAITNLAMLAWLEQHKKDDTKKESNF
jgi:hypothetical protein